MVPPTDSYKFFPYTTLFRSEAARAIHRERGGQGLPRIEQRTPQPLAVAGCDQQAVGIVHFGPEVQDRKTRLNSSHSQISYAVFCLKKKNSIHVIFIDVD